MLSSVNILLLHHFHPSCLTPSVRRNNDSHLSKQRKRWYPQMSHLIRTQNSPNGVAIFLTMLKALPLQTISNKTHSYSKNRSTLKSRYASNTHKIAPFPHRIATLFSLAFRRASISCGYRKAWKPAAETGGGAESWAITSSATSRKQRQLQVGCGHKLFQQGPPPLNCTMDGRPSDTIHSPMEDIPHSNCHSWYAMLLW